MLYLDHDEIARRLTYDVCIPAVRQAMLRLSRDGAKQIPRAVLQLSSGRLFGLMAGEMGERSYFGSKVISVFHENSSKGLPSHQGLVVLFDPQSGAPLCAADAVAVTAIRTAAASAAATDALARKGAARLALLGGGEQAAAHARAICKVRDIRHIAIWGRSPEKAEALAQRMGAELGVEGQAFAEAEDAVRDADIICTVTAARDPVLAAAWAPPGVHVNAVGSSLPDSAEIDDALVAGSRFIADCRENVMRAGGEFLRAQEAGLVNEDHIAAEIGEVYSAAAPGRQTDAEITVYKSLGHIVQDLAAVAALLCD